MEALDNDNIFKIPDTKWFTKSAGARDLVKRML
jgi:hypothetical protein